jgi:hypothetical protein
VTAFICHLGYEVTKDVAHRLADGVDPDAIITAGAVAGSVPGGHPCTRRARWTGRAPQVEIGGWVDPELTAKDTTCRQRQNRGSGAEPPPNPTLDKQRVIGVVPTSEQRRLIRRRDCSDLSLDRPAW